MSVRACSACAGDYEDPERTAGLDDFADEYDVEYDPEQMAECGEAPRKDVQRNGAQLDSGEP
jgi:hypothetical protein